MADLQTLDLLGRAIPFSDEGQGPAVVLVSGAGQGVEYFAPLAHSLVEEDFRVVLIDSRRDSDPNAQELAGEVVGVLDHLGVADAWVGGHGFGGSVARFVAHDHHDRANGVLLLGVEGSAGTEVAGSSAPVPEGLPVLVVQGSDDDVTPPANGEELLSAAPGLVSIVTVDGGGHLFPHTHVGATAWAIEDYLDWD
ncbi:alpha/beta hydrolase [Herbiconiux moechotypicola]|uniref:Alpha/beta hydrolase fold-5 domain-containing protein n=1 Tax=Herbiconiux moechotypicola TaxID=637393 RepID=A0ABP5Q0N3_9MICO|nr:alpha/beta hydrolase [Herbiconiux moechotypicola]MCS5728583.1 alpha/beta hydrolase [Herbiconiux moechotypicola]